MELYYHPELIQNPTFSLTEEEAQHALRTRRLRNGDQLYVTDGLGNRYHCEILNDNLKQQLLRVIDKSSYEAIQPVIQLYVAPLKQEARFEWLIEKAVELGVNRIQPIITDRTEKVHLRYNRLEKILIAAMKQSLKYHKPILAEALPLKQVWPKQGHLLFAHCMEGAKQPIQPAMTDNPIHLFIGPEGDFSPAELESARQQLAIEISLGQARLRTETAAIVALTQCHHAWQLNQL